MEQTIDLEGLRKIFQDRHLKNLLIDRTGYSRRNVNHVLRGRHDNRFVIDTAYDIILEEKERYKAINQK